MKHEIRLNWVRRSRHKTTEKDARRIAIRATNEFLREHSGEEDTNRLLALAVGYEQMIYESAKRLKLATDPLPEEDQRREIPPLKLHSYPGPWGGPLINIIPEEEGNGNKTRRPSIRKIHVPGRPIPGIRRKPGLSSEVAGKRAAVHSIRR